MHHRPAENVKWSFLRSPSGRARCRTPSGSILRIPFKNFPREVPYQAPSGSFKGPPSNDPTSASRIERRCIPTGASSVHGNLDTWQSGERKGGCKKGMGKGGREVSILIQCSRFHCHSVNGNYSVIPPQLQHLYAPGLILGFPGAGILSALQPDFRLCLLSIAVS